MEITYQVYILKRCLMTILNFNILQITLFGQITVLLKMIIH